MRAKRGLEAMILTPEARQNKQVIRLIGSINEDFLVIQNIDREINIKRREIDRMQDSRATKVVKKNQAIVDLSLMIMEIENIRRNEQDRIHIGPHEIFLEDEDGARRRDYRANAAEIARYVEFLYSTDTLNDNLEAMVAEVEQVVRRHDVQQ